MRQPRKPYADLKKFIPNILTEWITDRNRNAPFFVQSLIVQGKSRMSNNASTPLAPAFQWTLFCDGASRGNPGPAAIGYALLENENEDPFFQTGEIIGTGTNNEAEYRALIAGIESASHQAKSRGKGVDLISLNIFMDSELVVRQINGIYKVKNDRLKGLHKMASGLLKEFHSYRMEHIRREKNGLADSLANRALDASG